MRKLNFQNKPNTSTPINASNLNLVQDYAEQIVQLKVISTSTPEAFNEGEKYYNSTEDKIYTATENGWENPETPLKEIIYINMSEDYSLYYYDEIDHELIKTSSAGGGGGTAVAETLKIGSILPYSGETEPNGYMICDGRAINRREYAELFSVIGTTFGEGDGTNTFNIPNLKGRIPVGLDSEDEDFNTLGKNGGSKYLQEHQHTGIKWYNQYHSVDGGSGARLLPSQATGGSSNTVNQYSTGNVKDVTTGNSGNLQPYQILNYIIKVSNAQTGEILSETLPVGSEINYDGEEIPSGWEEVDDKAEILWTNSNPSNYFNAQTITLKDNDCDIIEIFYYAFKSVPQVNSVKIPLGETGILLTAFQYTNHGFVGMRSVKFTNNTTVQFYDTTSIIANDSFSKNTVSDWAIPIKIVGYRTGLFS